MSVAAECQERSSEANYEPFRNRTHILGDKLLGNSVVFAALTGLSDFQRSGLTKTKKTVPHFLSRLPERSHYLVSNKKIHFGHAGHQLNASCC